MENKITRKQAIKKAGYMAASAATMMVLLGNSTKANGMVAGVGGDPGVAGGPKTSAADCPPGGGPGGPGGPHPGGGPR